MAPRFRVEAFEASSQASEPARVVEAEAFLDAFGNTRDVLEAEYEDKRDNTVFLAVIDNDTDATLGSSRLILDVVEENKTILDAARAPWNLDLDVMREQAVELQVPWSMDVTTLSMSPQYRASRAGGVSASALMHSLVRMIEAFDVHLATAMLDVKVLNLVNRVLGDTWTALPGAVAHPYLGSPATLPTMSTPERTRTALMAQSPKRYQELYDDGNDPLVSYPEWNRLPVVVRRAR